MFTHRMDLRSYHIESCSHTHDFAQLVLPITGSMELEVGQYSGVVNDSTAVYIAPNERHCFAGSQQNLFLVIDVTHKNKYVLNGGLNSYTLNVTSNTKKLIHFAYSYLMNNERDFFTDSLVNQLLFHIATQSFSSEPDPLVLKAKNWIDCYFASPVEVKHVAQHCHLSVSQLQRRFKLIMGYGIAEYWRLQKLHHAKRLLSIKNCSIEAIAFEIGYENLPAFSRRFGKVFGLSPSQWRMKTLTAKKMRQSDN